MFAKAIEIAAKYTRAIHSISRNYGSTTIQPGTASLIFINSDGWALTCRHIINQLDVGASLARKRDSFHRELASRQGTEKEKRLLKELEKKYSYKKNFTFELHNRFIGCVEGNLKLNVVKHKEYDLALIKFENYTQLLCDTFPIFPSDTSSLQQGKMLCRLGFPFPEFTNFAYDDKADKLTWTDTGRTTTPRFPIEGMVTRHVVDDEGKVFAFEMSTPGLRGQSGGPAFDTDGKVWGLQFATQHLDLNFDIDQEVLRKGVKKHIKDSPFLHVGRCIHVDVIKIFLKENNVVFTEG